jgi:hypothetical protein
VIRTRSNETARLARPGYTARSITAESNLGSFVLPGSNRERKRTLIPSLARLRIIDT